MGGDKTIIHCCVEKETYDMLIRHCEATGQTKTTAIKRAIKAYCGSAEKESKNGGERRERGDGDE